MDRSIRRSRRCSHWFLALGIGVASATSIALAQAQEMCGGRIYPFPYTDVSAVGAPFCPGIMEAYVTGVTKGTTPTTFGPNDNVSRLQMTTFLQRSLDQGLTRASRRTVLKHLWQTNSAAGPFSVSGNPIFCAADGENLWVASASSGTVDQVQPSTGKILGTWTGATNALPVFPIPDFVVVADSGTPGHVWFIAPGNPPGAVTGAITLPGGPSSIAYDGASVWIADFSGSVSIVNMNTLVLTNISTGFSQPVGVLYDGAHIWVTDYGAGKLLQLGPTGTILNSVTVGAGPSQPVFDGENIWVPNSLDNSITVVQASTARVVATIVADGVNNLSGPEQASFDGERILVTNPTGSSFTLFKAADLSVIANVSTAAGAFGGSPRGTCSDGIQFWLTISGSPFMTRF